MASLALLNLAGLVMVVSAFLLGSAATVVSRFFVAAVRVIHASAQAQKY